MVIIMFSIFILACSTAAISPIGFSWLPFWGILSPFEPLYNPRFHFMFNALVPFDSPFLGFYISPEAGPCLHPKESTGESSQKWGDLLGVPKIRFQHLGIYVGVPGFMETTLNPTPYTLTTVPTKAPPSSWFISCESKARMA